MNLIKISKNKISQTKEVAGLLASHVIYEVASARGQLNYTGPRIDRTLWHQVMSFLRWTNNEMQSESQVRLYVNLRLGRWGAWAFPQAARTGMTAEELHVTETPEQAIERFASWDAEPSGDWLYFCTVHHHCSAGAFQSGTDERNEQNQDGLHITIGKMDCDRHDLHARFYVAGNRFEPDMSLFWELDPGLAKNLPPHLWNDVARYQMCEKVTVDFPEAWRKNIIEVRPQERRWPSTERDVLLPEEYPLEQRLTTALEAITHQFMAAGISDREYDRALQKLCEDPACRIIVEACLESGLLPGDLAAETELPFY